MSVNALLAAAGVVAGAVLLDRGQTPTWRAIAWAAVVLGVITLLVLLGRAT